MGRGLVRDQLGDLAPAQDLRQQLRRVAQQPDAAGLVGIHVLLHQGQGRIQVVRPFVQVARVQAFLDAGLVHVNGEADAAVHGDRQGLGTAHAAQACREGPGGSWR